MKLRLLNAGHQALAYFGYLCGYRFVHEAAQDPVLRAFLVSYLDEEAAPTLPPVPGIDLHDYSRSIVERFSNAQVGDPLERLCAWASDRIPKWLVPVIRAQRESGGEVRRSAAVVASWARHAEGVDEQGRRIDVVDSLAPELTRTTQREREDPGAFIGDRRLFDGLGDAPRFVSAFRSTLESLHEGGARATLEALVGTQHAQATNER